ncbi:MAG TPA: hypothetical protein GX008_06360 [Firmicutes bacterium]|jgi:putative FmdB family regulatory protein|nr:MAG: hypothetical protein AA931_04230 [Peptococcaceae bacterium 1109]HHT73316.1 hypothetical protein [Bacillota bacterium]
MPKYDYRCDHCGRFELEQSIKDDPVSVCPTCGGKAERLISKNVGIIFKGSGFYVNDSRATPPPACNNTECNKECAS